MPKVIDYYIVLSDKDEDITRHVKTMINQGWQPFGAPFLTPSGTAQTMVIYEGADNVDN